jgi:hypothetical protein
MLITEPATSDATRRGRPAPEPPTTARMLEEVADLIEVVPVAGPPAIFLVAPLVLLALMVAGPFLALLTIVAVLVVAAVLVALVCAVVASPFLLVRHLRGRRARAAASSSSRRRFRGAAPRLAPIRSREAAA